MRAGHRLNNRAWLEEIMSKEIVRHRFLPPHAGGAPAARHVGSPFVMMDTAAAAERTFGGNHPRPSPAEQQQRVQGTGGSRLWLQGPLQECARNARSDDGALARSLLDAGAATDVTDRTGRSPLHWACTRGNIAVAVALLEAGADGAARDAAGKTPLHCAAQMGHTQIVLVLLDHYGFVSHGLPSPSIFVAPPSPSTAAPAAAVEKALLPVADAEAAVMQQHDERSVASVVDALNAYGSTALHRAAFNGREDVVLALMRGGADVRVVGKSGRSALHLACQNAHSACVGILLAWGADESAVAKDGSTPWSELAMAAEERPPNCPRVAEAAFLLNAARGSRAWGRRGWLLMLKAWHSGQSLRRAQQQQLTKMQDEPKRESGATVSEKARSGVGIEGAPHATVTATVGDYMDVGGESHGEREAQQELASLVAMLLALGEDGCFRLVVGYL